MRRVWQFSASTEPSDRPRHVPSIDGKRSPNHLSDERPRARQRADEQSEGQAPRRRRTHRREADGQCAAARQALNRAGPREREVPLRTQFMRKPPPVRPANPTRYVAIGGTSAISSHASNSATRYGTT